MEQYDHERNTWQSLPSMLAGRGRLDVGMVGGRLYACGGSDGTQELKTVECYDPDTQKWQLVTNMLIRRSNAGKSRFFFFIGLALWKLL